MGKVVALDVGTKRTGVAETDPLQIIASGLTTIETTTLLFFLDDLLKKEPIDLLVVGEPKRLHGQASEVETYIKQVIVQINKAFPNLPIVRVDERFTSKMASQAIAQSGLKKKDRQKKERIDEVSAVIILQTWLNRQR